MLKEMGFNIPTYCGYTFDSRYEGRMKIKNDLIYIQSIQEPCMAITASDTRVEYEDLSEDEEPNEIPSIMDIRIYGGNA
jgi:hypothetical protein